ncbi:hypothetical protein Clow_01450 [Corynebacterium lowii]|uniref:T-Q ester bond containing domain-containing protein n=2 Tax=Corynebacterium lowii TaxID=1544413 RepID=A0A0Q0YUS3_9CORY|nr:hypothetical protein Clow_01450 [Corynebacterium lowii]
MIPIDQPGVAVEPKPEEPKTEVPTSDTPTTSVTTERPAPKSPVIGTSADFADGAKRVVAGATVNDTVTYKDLVPGKKYKLSAELVDKADGKTVVGTGSVEFTASESGDGEVVVPIVVNDDVKAPVESAVAFETLTSQDAEAQENRAEKLTDGSKPSGEVIADHKDPNDDAQTVTSEPVKTADVKLKKYIGAKAENADSLSVAEAEALNDSQTVEQAHKAGKADEDLTVAFVVENTGALDLKDLQLSDAAIKEAFKNAVDGTEAGVDDETPQVSNIRAVDAEKQKLLKSGEKMVFVGDLKAPAAGKLHADKADVAGVPVDDEGEPTAYTPVDDKGQPQKDEQGNPVVNEPEEPVKSDEDQAHATTPESLEPSLETVAEFDGDAEAVKPGVTVNDTVSYKDLVPGKQYTLDAQLVDKADGKTVVGEGSVTFTPESASGEQVVPIKVDDGVTEPVAAAVAFETLSSKDEDALAQRASDEVLDGEPAHGGIVELPKSVTREAVVAVHHDIEDEDQTVESKETKNEKPSEATATAEENPVKPQTPSDESSEEPTDTEPKPVPSPTSAISSTPEPTPEKVELETPEPEAPKTPKLELKKYINGNDSQEWDAAEELEPGEKAEVTFVVKNTGNVDLKDVVLSDETVEGVGDVTGIAPEKIDLLKVGASETFTGELVLPESDVKHKDVAKAEGVPVDESGKEIPWVDEDGVEHKPGEKVVSNDDPAHAVTPKPGESVKPKPAGKPEPGKPAEQPKPESPKAKSESKDSVSKTVLDKKRERNSVEVIEGEPDVGTPVAPKTPRRSIKAIPSGSLVWDESLPAHI